MTSKDTLLPYSEILPGFEAHYTGESSSTPIAESDGTENRFTDRSGYVCFKWDLWALSGVGADWGVEIQCINGMQNRLENLSDDIRKVRNHISSLVQCDSGIPATIDQVLDEIANGQLHERAFHAGCWMSPAIRGTQPEQMESMQVIEDILQGYLTGRTQGQAQKKFPKAQGFIKRAYEWLGPLESLTQVRKLMLERNLLPFELFTGRSRDHIVVDEDCFGSDGRGAEVDREIASLAGLPPIFANYKPEFQENLSLIKDADKRKLYMFCGAIAHGTHGLSDCHHSTFRWIESWLHCIGTGHWRIPDRIEGTERERIGKLLFGYVLGLDRWLTATPMQFLLLDLGHVNLGFDPKNDILRVYAYLGEDRTDEKEWLAACLWYHLYNCLHHWNSYKTLLDRAAAPGFSIREWIDARL